MYFQLTCLGKGLTKLFTGMWLLSAMVKFVSFEVASVSIGFTTMIVGMSFLFPMDSSCIFNPAVLVQGLPQILQEYGFYLLWLSLCLLKLPVCV